MKTKSNRKATSALQGAIHIRIESREPLSDPASLAGHGRGEPGGSLEQETISSLMSSLGKSKLQARCGEPTTLPLVSYDVSPVKAEDLWLGRGSLAYTCFCVAPNPLRHGQATASKGISLSVVGRYRTRPKGGSRIEGKDQTRRQARPRIPPVLSGVEAHTPSPHTLSRDAEVRSSPRSIALGCARLP